MIVQNVWGSLIKLCQSIITSPWQLHDWDAHSDTQELPDASLLGPAAIAVEEMSEEFVKVTFAIGISAYNDPGLFQHRLKADLVFEALRVGNQITYYDAETTGVLIPMDITGPTGLSPMTRANTRPFQFIQTEAVLNPYSVRP